MAYSFTFDFSKLSQSFFRDIAKFSDKKRVHEKMGNVAQYMIKKFNVDGITGLPVSDSVTVIEDLIDTQVKNVVNREGFLSTRRRALLLPHCSRKYMDSRCKADFNPELMSYVCNQCSPDCLVNKATNIAKDKGYDVYVLPGGSGIRKIIRNKGYEGIIGVACTEEVKLGMKLIKHMGRVSLGVPLIKNGCSGTKFDIKMLEQTMV